MEDTGWWHKSCFTTIEPKDRQKHFQYSSNGLGKDWKIGLEIKSLHSLCPHLLPANTVAETSIKDGNKEAEKAFMSQFPTGTLGRDTLPTWSGSQ